MDEETSEPDIFQGNQSDSASWQDTSDSEYDDVASSYSKNSYNSGSTYNTASSKYSDKTDEMESKEVEVENAHKVRNE